MAIAFTVLLVITCIILVAGAVYFSIMEYKRDKLFNEMKKKHNQELAKIIKRMGNDIWR